MPISVHPEKDNLEAVSSQEGESKLFTRDIDLQNTLIMILHELKLNNFYNTIKTDVHATITDIK